MATTEPLTAPAGSMQLERIVAPELDRLARLGKWLAAAETKDPDETQRGAAAALRLAYAESLGLPLMAAVELSIINGRLVVSAQLLRALAERHGLRVLRGESTDETCTAKLLDAGGQLLGEATFTMADAQRAGLIRDRSAWKTHPARMLWARASANVIKDFAPSVALGLLLEDEAQEIQRGTGQVIEGELVTDPLAERDRLYRYMGALIDEFEADETRPTPHGVASWDEWSKQDARVKFGVESRAQLTTQQLEEHIKDLRDEAIPF